MNCEEDRKNDADYIKFLNECLEKIDPSGTQAIADTIRMYEEANAEVYVPSTAIKFEPEQEIELLVKMSPKATRNIVVRITARNKGIPNPIL